MTATLAAAAAAARRAINRRRAYLLPSCSVATTNYLILDGLNGTETRIECPVWRHRCSSPTQPLSTICRQFSSESTKPSNPDHSDDSTSQAPRHRPKSNELKPLIAEALPHLTSEEYDPEKIIDQIFIAAKWNQGRFPQKFDGRIRNRKNTDRKWDYEFVRLTFDDYERHLRYVLAHLKAKRSRSEKSIEGSPPAPKTVELSSPELLADIHSSSEKCSATHRLLSPKVLANAIRSLTRSKMDTNLLSHRIRDIESLVGNIGWTPITEELSYRLLEANGKAGNVRRTLALLELRKKRGYPPREQDYRTFSDVTKSNDDQEVLCDDDSLNQDTNIGIARGEKEFIHAIKSIISAQLPLRRSRNIYLHESSFAESSLDNPTRYLDAILLNMSQRGIPLRPEMANQMLSCYASTGRTGRALHYFYKVVRDPVDEDGFYIPGPHPTHLSKAELEEWMETRKQLEMGRLMMSGIEKAEGEVVDANKEKDSMMLDTLDYDDEMATKTNSWGGMSKTKPRMIMHPPPPFHKIPSNVKETPLARSSEHKTLSFVGAPRGSTTASSSLSSLQPTYAQSRKTKTKYEWEVDSEWSLSLTAAFAFADSLTHGACGHAAIELNVGSWNCLIKACCYRGAFHRALKILNETMPQKGIEPDSFSYNTILAGLARVGDIQSLKELLVSMTNKRVPINKYTVQAIADGLLNVGDISGASTTVQDIFNQHDTLPPYTTHLKIIEFALSNGLIFEAKRHVYFVQQLWKWQPSPHHDNKFRKIMEATQHNPKLSKGALQKLFGYFGEELRDEDFL